MFQQKQVVDVVLRLSYFVGIGVGLFPALLNWRNSKFKPLNYIYLLYSGVLHSIILFIIMLGMLKLLLSSNYDKTHTLVKLSDSMAKFSKVSAITVIVMMLWLQRCKILNFFNAYNVFLLRYRRFHRISQLRMKESKRMVLKLKNDLGVALINHFLSGLGVVVLSIGMFFNMRKTEPKFDKNIWFQAAIYSTTVFLLTSISHFHFVVHQLTNQFSYINMNLKDICAYLEFHRNPFSGRFGIDAADMSPVHDVAKDIHDLCTMHLMCFKLSQRFFRLSECTVASVILKLFMSNIEYVYRAFLYSNKIEATNDSLNLNGTLTIVFFYWNTFQVVKAIDGLLKVCNRTGIILRSFSALETSVATDCPLEHELDSFCAYLRNHKLRFLVCGCFQFNKATSLQCLFVVFVNVAILMQFDKKHGLY